MKVHKEVKKTLENLLVAIIETENPNYSRSALNAQLETRIQGTLSKRLAHDMIAAMYSHDEQKKNQLIQEINQCIEASSTNRGQKTKTKDRVLKEEIRYRELEKLVLDNLVRTHRDYLVNVRLLFRRQDSSNYGYIDKTQFNALLQSIDALNAVDVDQLYESVNPNEVEHITFSELVQGFAEQKIEHEGQKVTILDYIHTLTV